MTEPNILAELEGVLGRINGAQLENRLDLIDDYVKVVQVVRKLDPEWYERAVVTQSWVHVLVEPQRVADESLGRFTALLQYRSLMVTPEILQLWLKLDKETVHESITNMNPDNGCLKVFKENWPDEFLAYAQEHKDWFLRVAWQEWQELDPNGYFQALKEEGPRYSSDAEVGVRWAKANPEDVNRIQMGAVTSNRAFKEGLTKMGILKKTTNHNWSGQYTCKVVYEVWSEQEPENFLTFAHARPSYVLNTASELWYELDPEGYLKAVKKHPMSVMDNPDLLHAVDPELLRQIVEETIETSDNWADNSNNYIDWSRTMMLVNPERYSALLPENHKLINCYEEWYRYDKQAFTEALDNLKGQGTPDFYAYDRMLSFLADEDPDLFVKMCYQTSTNPPNKLIPSLEVLEKLKGINPEAWAEVGGNATLAYLMRESRQADLRTEFAMTLLAYYQEHQDELVEQLMKPNVDAKVYLPLASGLFTEENYQKLLQAITQTPGQLVDKAAWAAQHVGELEAGGTNGGRKLKVRTRKVEKEGPGIA